MIRRSKDSKTQNLRMKRGLTRVQGKRRIQESKDLNIKKQLFFQHLYFADAVKRLELTQEMSRNGFEETPTRNLTLQQFFDSLFDRLLSIIIDSTQHYLIESHIASKYIKIYAYIDITNITGAIQDNKYIKISQQKSR